MKWRDNIYQCLLRKAIELKLFGIFQPQTKLACSSFANEALSLQSTAFPGRILPHPYLYGILLCPSGGSISAQIVAPGKAHFSLFCSPNLQPAITYSLTATKTEGWAKPNCPNPSCREVPARPPLPCTSDPSLFPPLALHWPLSWWTHARRRRRAQPA
jgi:hypothetical protein